MSTDVRYRVSMIRSNETAIPIPHAATDCQAAAGVANEFRRSNSRISSPLYGLSMFANEKMEQMSELMGNDYQVGWIRGHPEKEVKRKIGVKMTELPWLMM